MNLVKTICLGTSVVGLLIGPGMEAWARGSPGGGPASCLIAKTSGTRAIHGTMAIEITSGVGTVGQQDADVTVRLESGGVQQFFRVHVVDQFAGLSNDEIVCRIFDDVANPDVQGFVQEIRSALGLASGTHFFITSKSITGAEAFDADLSIPGTDPLHASSIADVTLYVK